MKVLQSKRSRRTDAAADTAPDDRYETIAVELIRSLRGRRSCAEFSRRIGYRSNIAHRWEARQCWPTAARFLEMQQRVRPASASWLERFFHAVDGTAPALRGGAALPAWAVEFDPVSPQAVAAFLRHLKGKTPTLRVAALAQRNRYSVARWFDGSAEPKLPEFLRLVDVSGRRLLDLLASFDDPARLYSVRAAWAQLQLARVAAYERPWSHAVLRALELLGSPGNASAQLAWIAQHLSIGVDEVTEALAVLQATGQVKKTRGGFKPRQVIAVDTSRDPEGAHALKLAWTGTALERLRAHAPGSFGYSVFAVSHADLERLRNLHLQYVRAMQAVIASSSPAECVGLYCAQLLDLGRGASRTD